MQKCNQWYLIHCQKKPNIIHGNSNEQNYGVSSYFKVLKNNLHIMGCTLFIYTCLRKYVMESFQKTIVQFTIQWTFLKK
jgi:hypothetical protein